MNLNKETAVRSILALGFVFGSLIGNASTTLADCRKGPNAQCNGENLQSLDWRRANLDGANFQNANLEYADFSGASLKGADFSGANLQQTRFERSDLSGAN